MNPVVCIVAEKILRIATLIKEILKTGNFSELEQITLNLYKPQKTSNNQNNLEKKNKLGFILLPDFKLYYKALMIRNDMVLVQKQTHRSGNIIENETLSSMIN